MSDEYTKLLIHFDSSPFLDSSDYNQAITTTEVVFRSSVKKFGTGSGVFYTGRKLTVANNSGFDIRNGDFTIDFWIRPIELPSNGNFAMIVSRRDDSDNYWYFGLYNNNGSYEWRFRSEKDNSNLIQVTKSTTVSTNTWYHIAITRSTNDYSIYQNGSLLVSATTNDNPIADLSADICINNFNDDHYFYGYLDELRFSNGICRFIGNFTPPASAYDSAFPTNVTATKNDSVSNRIDISWDDNCSDEDYYSIERRINIGSWEVLNDTLPANTTTYSDTTATEIAFYYYRVRAKKTNYYPARTDYGYSNRIDTTADTKLIAFSDEIFYGLSSNIASGTWETLPWYKEGTVSVSGNTVSGSATCKWYTESNVQENYYLFYIPSGASSIDYSNAYLISGVNSDTSLDLAVTPTTGCSSSSYVIAKNFTSGEKCSFLDYDQLCFIAKQSDNPIYYDMTHLKPMGVAYPSTACTATKATGSGLEEGVYKYKITYVYGTYGESNGNATEATETTTSGSQKINLTSIPIGGKDVTARRVYRTEVGGAIYYRVTTIEDNSTTTYSDTMSDTTLASGGITIPTTHTEPTKLVTIAERNTRIFGADSLYPYTLRYTAATKPYAWYSLYTIDRSGKGRIMRVMNAFEALLIFFDRGIEMGSVDDADTTNWSFEDVQTAYGLASRWAVTKGNEGVYFLSIKDKVPGIQFLRRGEQSVVNATFDSLVPDSLSEKIDNFMKEININAIETSTMSFYDNKLRLSVPYGNSVTPNRTCVYDFRRDAFSIITKGYLCFTEAEGKLLAGTEEDKYAHQLEYEYTWSDGSSISMRSKTGYLDAGRRDLTKEFQIMRIETEASSGTLGLNWNIDHNTRTGSYSFDLSQGRYFEVYFPIGSIGKAIQLDMQCTNNVSTVIKAIQIMFQPYDFGA